MFLIEVYNLAAETVISLATPDMDVTLLELDEENHETVESQDRVFNQHESQETFERTSPEALQELLARSAEHLTNSETERLQGLLYNYQHVFRLSDGDLSAAHLVHHRIEAGNVPSIRQQPRRTSPWKKDEI